MKLLYFGRLAEIAGTRGGEVALPAHVTTVAAARDWIGETQPELAEALGSERVRALADDEFVGNDRSLAGVAELAFLPPVSGG
ncbi:MAG: MoaD/ThiS family protein [Sphingomicrobium sp.]|nr:MoaD/ThiS family protein [Sphingomonadales bacterium]